MSTDNVSLLMRVTEIVRGQLTDKGSCAVVASGRGCQFGWVGRQAQQAAVMGKESRGRGRQSSSAVVRPHGVQGQATFGA